MSIIDDWFAFALGEALDPDGHYGNQCVDAVDHYGEFIFGVPWPQSVGAVQGARQLLDAAPDEFWTRIDYSHGFIPQRGDVLVYGGDQYNQWGHTAVTDAATNTYIDVLQQDGFGAPLKFVDDGWYSNKPAHRARLAYSQNGTGPLRGVLRPRTDKLKSSTIQAQGTTITPLEDIFMALTEAQQLRILAAADRINGVIDDPQARVLTTNHIDAVATSAASKVLNTTVARGGAGAGLGPDTNLGAVVAWFDSAVLGLAAAINSQAAASGATPDQVIDAVKQALATGVVKVDVSVGGAK